MSTSLLNNYISTATMPVKKPQQQVKTANAPAPIWKPQTGVVVPTGVAPLHGRGKLVKGNIFNAPATAIKGLSSDMKALKAGLKGQANDHQLGKLNDVGMKLGSLAIAAYLFTKRGTSLTKGMEIVGPISFFASMALWPKIGLQLPAKLVHGFNINQKYEDAQGRKKPVFQDNQFVPFDLYTDEQINKIGDKMKIDKDIPNRRDIIQEKMKKIAAQNNTLWMLTAGIATPVMSALACNGAEKIIAPIQNHLKNKKADGLLENFEQIAKKRQNNASMNTLNSLFELHRDKPVTGELIDKITSALSKGLDNETISKGLRVDLGNMLVSGKSTINETLANNILASSKEALSQQFDGATVGRILPKADELVDFFKQNNMLDKNLGQDELLEFGKKINKFVQKRAKEANIDADVRDLMGEPLLNSIKNAFKTTSASMLDNNAITSLKGVAQTLGEFTAKTSVLDEFARIKAGNAPETVLANGWNNIADSLCEILKIDPKKMTSVKHDRELTQKLLRETFENITSNDDEYKRVVSAIAKKVAQLDETIKPADVLKYTQKITPVFDQAATALANTGMSETANQLTALGVQGKGSLKRIQGEFVNERILGVKTSFYRFLDSMDMYRRVSKLDLGAELDHQVPREMKEEIIELCKRIAIGGHSSDHAVKLPFQINPFPNLTDKSQIEVVAGKVVNKFFGKTQGVDIPGNYEFYQKAMKFMFGGKLDDATEQILKKAGLLDKVKAYNKEFLEKVGGSEYFIKPFHKICNDLKASSEYKFLLGGATPDQLVNKLLNKTSNTNKWLKIFGTVGVALVAVTVASQFLFGKLDNMPKKAQEKK